MWMYRYIWVIGNVNLLLQSHRAHASWMGMHGPISKSEPISARNDNSISSIYPVPKSDYTAIDHNIIQKKSSHKKSSQ